MRKQYYKYRLAFGIGVLFLVSIWFGASSTLNAKTFYVSPDGNDQNPGTADRPIASLQEAARCVREYRKSGEFLAKPEATTVLLKSGRWFLSEPLVLTSDDSGTKQAPILWTADAAGAGESAGQKAVLSGGLQISGWTKLERGTNPDTGDGFEIWSAPLPQPLASKPDQGTQLFINNVRAVRARTPNVSADHDSDKEYFLSKRMFLDSKAGGAASVGLKAKTGQIDALILDSNGKPDPAADLVLFQCWSSCHNRIAQYDAQTGRVDFTRPLGRFYLGSKNRFYIENTRPCLDQPGEWLMDRTHNRVLYIPKPGEQLDKADAIVSFVPQTLIRIDGDSNGAPGKTVDYVNFSGLTFEHTDADLSSTYPHSVQGCDTQRGAFDATGWRYSELFDCVFAHVGENGMNLMAGCAYNQIRRNRLFDLGAGGIYLPDKPKPPVADGAVTAHNIIDNNLIYDGGRIYHAACGVFLAGLASYNQISHNDISDFTWTAIHLGWSWSSSAKTWTHHNDVGYNHLHRIGNGVLSDLAGIYMLGVSTGTVVHHNRIPDIARFDRGYGGWGIYFDAGSSEITVQKNVVYRTDDGGLHLHNYDFPYGDTVTNNVFGTSKNGSMIRNAAHNTKTHPYHARVTKNIVFNESPSLLAGSFWGADQKVQLDENCYWTFGDSLIRFPVEKIAKQADTGVETDKAAVNAARLNDWKQQSGQDAKSIAADPKFVNRTADDYRLASDSPARAIGIESIDDIAAAGLYGDPRWTNEALKITPRVNEFCSKSQGLTEYRDNFEEYEPGDHPEQIACIDGNRADGQPSEAGISISSDQKYSGKQSLKVTDAAGLSWVHDPNLALTPAFANGKIVQTFELHIDQKPVNAQIEWRDYSGGGYKTGLTFNVKSEPAPHSTAVVTVSGKVLTRIPEKTWVRFTVEFVNRAKESPDVDGMDAAWSVSVTVPGQERQTFGGFPCQSRQYRSVNWMGFISLSAEPASFYIDDWSVQVEK